MKNEKVFDKREKVSIEMVNMPIKHDKVSMKRQFVYRK